MKKKMLPGPRQDFLKGKPEELRIQTALIKKVCDKMPPLANRTRKWMDEGIDIANEWREVGLFYLELKQELPGKKMTIDFFRQFAPLFVDKAGKQITFEQLEWAAKLALQPEPFPKLSTEADGLVGFNVMLSYKQCVLGAAGFLELEGERLPQQAHEPNYYLRVLEMLDPSKLKTVMDKLEADPNFGAIEQWPEARKEKFWVQIKPMVDSIPAAVALIKRIAEKLGRSA